MKETNFCSSNKASLKIKKSAVLLRLNQKYYEGISQESLYRITRGEWVVGERRKRARYAFSIYRGIVLQVYRIHRWNPFTGKTPSNRQRWCFVGVVAENLQHYVGKSVKHYFVRGNANPVNYVNC